MNAIIKDAPNPFVVSLGDLGESKDCTQTQQVCAWAGAQSMRTRNGGNNARASCGRERSNILPGLRGAPRRGPSAGHLTAAHALT
eukprot:2927801-Prymnesium_polylepis.2